jgi:MFS family permease
MTRTTVRLLTCLGLLQLGLGLHGTVYLAFAAYVVRDRFGLAAAEAAVLIGATFLGYAVVQLLTGLVADLGVRLVGRKAMLVRVALVYTLAWGVFALAPTPPLFVVGGVLAGLGSASLPLMLAYVAERLPRERSGLVSGLLEAVLLAGQLLGLAAGWLLVSRGQEPALPPLVCLLWAATTLVLHLATPAEPVARAEAGRLLACTGERLRMLADPATRALKALRAIAAVGPLLAATYLPLLLIALAPDTGVSAAAIAASTGAGYLLGLVLTPALGLLVDRVGQPGPLLLGVLLAMAGALLLAGLSGDILVVSALAAAIGVGGRWLNALQNAILLRLAAAGDATTFFMANQLPFYAGLPLGLLLATGAIGATGSIGDAVLLVGGLFGLGAVLWGRHLWQERAAPAVPRAAPTEP